MSEHDHGRAELSARDVTIRQGGARTITAEAVTIRQGGAASVQAKDVEITQGGVVFARADEVEVTAGGVGIALAGAIEIEQSAAQFVAARESVKMDQSAAAVVFTGQARVRDSVIGVIFGSHVEGDNNRVLFGPTAALAFGAGFGVALTLARLVLNSRRR